MKFSSRVYVPVLLALILSAAIGGWFLWQIKSTVFTVESTFKSPVRQMNFLKKLFPGNEPDRLSSAIQSTALLKLRQGEILELKGEWKLAENSYTESVNAGGGVMALKKLALIQLQRREYDAVKVTIARLKEENPGSEDVMFYEGLLHLILGNTEEAGTVFSRNEDSPHSHFGLGLIALVKGENTQALNEMTIAGQGSDPAIRSYAETIQKAFSEFALFPDGQEIHLQTLLAQALARINQCEIALPILNRVIAAQDRYRDAWIVKGFCEFTSERSSDALKSLEKAYSLDPEKPETQYFLARTHAALGDPQNAVTYLQYALLNGFSPESDARELLAEYARELGNTELALEQYRLLADAKESSLESFERYVNLAISTQNHALDALSLSKKALLRWPDDSEALTLAAKAAFSAGLPEDAKKYIEKALKLDPKNPKVLEINAMITKSSLTN